MHISEREKIIIDAMGSDGFISYRQLEGMLAASPATIRRDLMRLEERGVLTRVHGGARVAESDGRDTGHLQGTPFVQSITQNLAQKEAIGKAAARLCLAGEGIMIDGGTTTLQMCQHLAGLDLQVLTNSLHIVGALLQQAGTRILVPSGTVYREQNIILAPPNEESMPRFYAPKLFMGAAAVGPYGVMQADDVLVAAERRLIERAEEVILLVDSSKFNSSSGTIVCDLNEVHTIVTDRNIPAVMVRHIEDAGVRLVIA